MSGAHRSPVRLVTVGRVLKPHGLRGELCIELLADSPFLFEELSRIYLELPGKKARPCTLEAWRPHQGRVLILVDRCQGRDQAESWRGASVLVRERDFPALDEDEFRPEDLLGLSVIRLDGTRVGVLEDMRDMAGREIWFVRDAADNEILLPAVEEIVVEIDLEQGLILIDPPAGLIELYQNG
jgi:16S rRNA processing protein RimM